jgi:hypothetical protein
VPQLFTAVFTDANGANDIYYTQIDFRPTTGAGRVNVLYFTNANLAFLLNDAGSAWLGGGAFGSVGSVENSFAVLDYQASSVARNGTTISVTFALTFKGPAMGNKDTYLFAQDTTGLQSGWAKKGTWTVPNQAPGVVSLSPNAGSSAAEASQLFTTVYSDVNGYNDLNYVMFDLRPTTGAGRVHTLYFPRANVAYLLNDAGTAWLGGGALGSVGTVQNSYATLNYQTSSAVKAGEIVTVTWDLTFKVAAVGNKDAYLLAQDVAGLNSGWVNKGTWTVTGGSGAPPSERGKAGQPLLQNNAAVPPLPQVAEGKAPLTVPPLGELPALPKVPVQETPAGEPELAGHTSGMELPAIPLPQP